MIPIVIGHAEISSRLPRGRFCIAVVPPAGPAMVGVGVTVGAAMGRKLADAGRALPVAGALKAPSEVLWIMAGPKCPAMMKIVLTCIETVRPVRPTRQP